MDTFRSFSSVLLVSKRLFSSTRGTSPELPFTVHYLVNRCGVPLESAINAAKKLASLITRRPKILLCRPKTTLKPKMDFLVENGFKGPFLHELILRNPSVLKRSVKSQLEPVFDFLRTAAVQSHERVVKSSGVVKLLGVEPKSALFIHVVRVMLSMNEINWNRKIGVLRSLGWSEDDYHSTFRRDPTCLGSSEEKIRKVMDFYLNTAKLDLDVIIKYPKFLTYGLDSRLRRRHVF
ncbi:hypothetical protein SAY87_029666 [Trapa incisa]|uniref:Mitochondrial transcription termination factor family protein n=1 Tax=Trapa incisa TaxID=236973 RepID=A0AAN7KDB5_9MYRT|nr:hypothetical protein SAY87_029666 [Trapa incisa]